MGKYKYSNQTPGNNPGYVYLLRRDNGLYKIGRTGIDVTMRQTSLRHQHGWITEQVWSIWCADQITTERAMHHRFFKKRVNREFFSLSDADVAWIVRQTEESICRGYDTRFDKPMEW